MAHIKQVSGSICVFITGLLVAFPCLAAELPPGFVDSSYVNVVSPTSMSFAPDGSLWILRDNPAVADLADVYRYHPDADHLILVGQITVRATGAGVQTIKVDPDFANNQYLWIYYTPGTVNRLSRFTVVNDTLTNEQIIVEGPPNVTDFHAGGCLAFDADGTIYLAIGDDSQGSATSQDPFGLHGTMIHISPDGSPVPGNPYFDGTAGDPRVWALGLRNPFRCNMQPETFNLFIGDVGGASWEEIDLGVLGGNYGWAAVEGPEPPGLPGYVYPIYSYFHDHPDGNAVVAGDHVEPGEFQPEYEGNYFFADHAAQDIRRMVLDENHNPVFTEIWATDIRQPVCLEFGPDGSLYYCAISGGVATGGVRRIEYVGGANSQPTARATGTPDNGTAPLTTTLDGTGSFDPDGDPLSYSWDFGDGQNAMGSAVVNHTYAAGVYEAVLTVDDGNGGQSISPPVRIVSGNHRPTASIAAPSSGLMYDAGDQISYSGSGTDTEEGTLACSQNTWQVVFHHLGHTHPFLGPEEGACSGSFTIPVTGETSAQTWYKIWLTVEDNGVPLGSGATLTGQDTVEIFPNTSLMTFESQPLPDLELTLDTQPFTPPSIVEGVVNFIRTVGATDGQLRSGHTYRWISWSDGGDKVHDIQTPSSDTTYTATFGCDVLVEVPDLELLWDGQQQELSLSWTPVADLCLNTGTAKYRIYAADTPVPTSLPGDFPNDPAFTLVGTSDVESFTYQPSPDHAFYLAVAVGTDLLDGPAGHYGP